MQKKTHKSRVRRSKKRQKAREKKNRFHFSGTTRAPPSSSFLPSLYVSIMKERLARGKKIFRREKKVSAIERERETCRVSQSVSRLVCGTYKNKKQKKNSTNERMERFNVGEFKRQPNDAIISPQVRSSIFLSLYTHIIIVIIPFCI